MLDLNNLNWEDKQDIDNIYAIATKVWDKQVKFGKIEVIDSPYPEFNLPVRLYNAYDITLEYERGTIGIMVNTPNGYIGLSRMTDEQVFRGLKSCKPENMLHNFKILDKVLKSM